MMQSIHVHKWQNWRTRFMAVRSPLEKAVLINMTHSFVSLKRLEIINKYDNYPQLGMTYTAIYDKWICFWKIFAKSGRLTGQMIFFQKGFPHNRSVIPEHYYSIIDHACHPPSKGYRLWADLREAFRVILLKWKNEVCPEFTYISRQCNYLTVQWVFPVQQWWILQCHR